MFTVLFTKNLAGSVCIWKGSALYLPSGRESEIIWKEKSGDAGNRTRVRSGEPESIYMLSYSFVYSPGGLPCNRRHQARPGLISHMTPGRRHMLSCLESTLRAVPTGKYRRNGTADYAAIR